MFYVNEMTSEHIQRQQFLPHGEEWLLIMFHWLRQYVISSVSTESRTFLTSKGAIEMNAFSHWADSYRKGLVFYQPWLWRSSRGFSLVPRRVRCFVFIFWRTFALSSLRIRWLVFQSRLQCSECTCVCCLDLRNRSCDFSKCAPPWLLPRLPSYLRGGLWNPFTA